MKTGRLEAGSDGVFAIIITIMVMQLNVPKRELFTAWREVIPGAA